MPDAAHEPGDPFSLAWAGDRFLRVSLGDTADEATLHLVRSAVEALTAASIPGLIDLTPAYTTILLTFDPLRTPDDAEDRARAVLRNACGCAVAAARTLDIPVCYGGPHGDDLDALAGLRGLTAQEAIALHSGAEYRVAFIGFTPGFAYLHGLPQRLSTPRLATPRPRVAPGSIGIAGSQTGIYPASTPGGWRLIGRTPLRTFTPGRTPPALLSGADRVRFVPITPCEFDRLNQHPESR